jgi:hypothetical protein
MRIIGGRILRGRAVRLIFEWGGTGEGRCEVEAVEHSTGLESR